MGIWFAILLVSGVLHVVLALREQDPGRRLSAVDTDLELHFAISLFPNYQEELDQLTNDLYDISSPLYGQFITSEEYVARFSPTVEQVETVSTYLSQNGLTVTEVNKNRMLIHAKGNVGAINSAFQIQLGHYSMGSDEEAYFQPDQKPTIPQGLSIIGIHGLSNKNKRHHNWKRGPKVTKEQMEAQVEKERQQPKEESNVLRRKLQQNGQLPFTPQGISKAYKLSSTYLGEAQAAAVVEFDTYLANDISAYTEFFGIRSVPLENILITVGADTPPLVPGDGQIEVTLDIQLLNAIAPNLTKIFVYIANNSDAASLALYSKISNDGLTNVVSTSWGFDEPQTGIELIQAEGIIYQKMAVQGIALFAAAGDNGAFGEKGVQFPVVDDPASQPFVTGVGGTTLFVNSEGDYLFEQVWLTPQEYESQHEGGGGGSSIFHPAPSYQQGVVSRFTGANLSARNVPDVSLNADPNTGYVIIVTDIKKNQQNFTIIGGTSCAAPLWTGFMAIVNEARLKHNLTVLGFANPAIYAIGKSSGYHSSFHDIVIGNNGFFPAITGYDDASGWGTIAAGDPLIESFIVTPPPDSSNIGAIIGGILGVGAACVLGAALFLAMKKSKQNQFASNGQNVMTAQNPTFVKQ